MKSIRVRVLMLSAGMFALGIFSGCPLTDLVSELIPSV
jgi:hypothetical protein